ncbi:MAG: LemA family protein [Planctomycetota bacterium]
MLVLGNILLIGLPLIPFALLGVWIAWTYNGLVRRRQFVKEAWSAIDTELQRRHDLVPNLVETVKGHAAHESGLFEAVATLRNRAAADRAGSADASQQAVDEQELTVAVGKLITVAEAYPDLKASDRFADLQRELSETETRISKARRFYNANVEKLNTAVASVPTNVVAGVFGFRKAAYFEAEDRSTPHVDFGDRS